MRNREPSLLPFNSIHHRYYRADSRVLSFLYNSSSYFLHSVSLTPTPCLLLGKRIMGAQLYSIFGVKTGPFTSPHSAVFSLLLSVLFMNICYLSFFFLISFNKGCKHNLHPPSLTVPSFFSFPTEGIWHLGDTVYCIKMYSGFINIHSIG